MTEEMNMIILLHIEKVTGLNVRKDPIICMATLNGNVLESEIVTPKSPTVFQNNLVWKTDIITIKNLQKRNIPIKLELFSIDSYDNHELIGHVLIPIRGIRINNSGKKIDHLKLNWCKIIGLASAWRHLKPEIQLKVVILNEQLNIHLTDNEIFIENDPKNVIESNPVDDPDDIFTNLLADEQGLLQIGKNEDDCYIFQLEIILKNAKNLDKVFYILNTSEYLFKLKYKILDSDLEIDKLKRQNDGTFILNEQINLKFRSSVSTLKKYFQTKFQMPIQIFYGDLIIGNTNLSLANMITVDTLDAFLSKTLNNNNTLSRTDRLNINSLVYSMNSSTVKTTDSNSTKPIIEYQCNLKYINYYPINNNEQLQDVEDDDNMDDDNCNKSIVSINNTISDSAYMTTSPRIITKSIYENEYDEGLCETVPSSAKLLENMLINENVNCTKQSPIVAVTTTLSRIPLAAPQTTLPSVPTQPAQPPPPQSYDTKETKDKGFENIDKPSPITTNTFTYSLILQSIKFNRVPDSGIWQISLQHSAAHNTYVLKSVELNRIDSELVDFNNIKMSLNFSSTHDIIRKIIESKTCILSVKGPRTFFGTATLNNSCLLAQENQSGNILLENENDQNVGMARGYVCLEDLGVNFNVSNTNNSDINNNNNNNNNKSNLPTSMYLDEKLAYKFIEELENWKTDQQTMFLKQLAHKENEYLTNITKDWRTEKDSLERTLKQKIQQCNELTATLLTEAKKTVQDRNRIEETRRKDMASIKIDLEKFYENKFLQLKEMIRRVETDYTEKLQMNGIQHKELMTENELLKNENKQLENNIKKLEDIIQLNQEKYNKSIDHEDYLKLMLEMKTLKDKLETSENSKLFYKQQWAKLLRNLHKMRRPNYQPMGDQTMEPFLGIKGIIDSERSDLICDQLTLKAIKDFIDCN